MNLPRALRPSSCRPLTSGLVLLGLSAAALGAPALQGKEERLSQRSFEVKGDYDAILGPGFEVMGEKVTPADLKRAIVVGTTGRNLLESAKLQVFIDEEIARQKEEGVDVSKYVVSKEDIDKAIEDADKMVKEEFQGHPEIQESRDLFAMPESVWFDQIEQTQLFDRVFLPTDPREYPATTVAALNQSAPDFVQRLIDGHMLKLKTAEETGEPVKEDPNGQAMFRQLMRQIVIGALNKSAEIKTFIDGIPPENALEVNGHPIKTEDIWRAIRWKVRQEDVDEATSWFERTITARKALEAAGKYMTDEEFENAYREYTAPYEASPFNMEAVAVSFKKFPSAEHYKAHFRLEESYKHLIENELTSENLQAHVNGRAGNLLGLAKVDVEVILISAYDFQVSAFKENGWEEAGQRAVACVKELAAGAPWEEMVDKYSEWYEPPVAKSTAASAASFSKNKGRFGLKNRNELLQQLGESDWSLFLNGYTVTDYIFFELEPGIPSQPLRGPNGYYIARVTRRTPPSSHINIEPTGQRPLVEQDYLATRFNAFCQEQLDKARAAGQAPQAK
jgi:hypothetical protein